MPNALWYGFLCLLSSLVLGKAYVYLPKILTDRYFDNILGAIVSDAFTVPMSAALVGILQLNWLWTSVITLIILGIEELFLKLHIHQHFWWKTAYTGLGLLLAFYLSKKNGSQTKKLANAVHPLPSLISNLIVYKRKFYVCIGCFFPYLFL